MLEETAGRIDPGLSIDETDGPAPSLDWSIGDPSLCQAKLGFTPASDLSRITQQAGNWVTATASQNAHA